jgi:hypothetical protein
MPAEAPRKARGRPAEGPRKARGVPAGTARPDATLRATSTRTACGPHVPRHAPAGDVLASACGSPASCLPILRFSSKPGPAPTLRGPSAGSGIYGGQPTGTGIAVLSAIGAIPVPVGFPPICPPSIWLRGSPTLRCGAGLAAAGDHSKARPPCRAPAGDVPAECLRAAQRSRTPCHPEEGGGRRRQPVRFP